MTMRRADRFVLVFVTAQDLEVARRLAGVALRERLVACANLLPRIESHYWWQGKLERSAEVLLLFKARKSDLGTLERVILSNHPYDTPEILAVPIQSGTRKYLEWLGDCTARLE